MTVSSVSSSEFDQTRMLTFDILRGFAIWLMLTFHILNHTIDYDSLYNAETGGVEGVPIPLLLILGLVLYMATWDGLFVFIAMVSNLISIDKNLKKGNSLEKVIKIRIKWGLIVFILGYLHNLFFDYNAFIVESLRAQKIYVLSFYVHIFNFIALQIIGLSIIVCSIIVYFLYKNNGQQKLKRNILILFGMAIFVLFFTPVVRAIIDNFYPGWPVEHKNWSTLHELPIKLFLAMISGEPQPVFPYFVTSLAGTIFGLALVNNKTPEKLPKYGIAASILMFASVGILVALGVPFTLTFTAPTPLYIVFELAGQMLLISVLLKYIEFGSKKSAKKSAKRTQYLRRLSMVALTLYFIQVLEFIPRYFVQLVFGWNAMDDNQLGPYQALIMMVIVLIFWEIVLRMWEKVNFKWSMEYTLIRAMSGGKIKAPSRLNTKKILYQVDPWVLDPEKAKYFPTD